MDWADPQRCETYLKGGRWLDAGKGNRNWQPDGEYLNKNVYPCDTT